MNETYSKPPKKNYATNKTDVYYIDNNWSLDILDLKDYGPESNRGYINVLVVIDNSPKFAWTLKLGIKNAPTIKNSSENTIKNSKRKPNIIKTDRGKEIYNNFFQNYFYKNNTEIYSRSTSLGAVFAERFEKTTRDLHKRPVFENVDGIWVDAIPTITKQYIIQLHSSMELTPLRNSLKENEGCVYQKLSAELKKINQNFK